MNRAFLCLGGNLGNRLENIEKALLFIEKQAGPIAKTSPLYETEAWGSKSAKKYLNLCVQIETTLSAKALMQKLLSIEKKLGRKRTDDRNADRTIDIDILFYNSDVIHTNDLQIPHPRLHLRKFVLKPLNDIGPNLKHPELGTRISKLLKDCKDPLQVKAFKDKKHRIICVEGNIGSGKTTLAKALAKKLNATFVGERFEENALLPLFYKNAKTYALPLETSFLMERFNQLATALIDRKNTIVCDHSIYKCLWFAKANLNRTDLKYFKNLYETIEKKLPVPHLIVYLNTSTSNLQNNIAKRGRSYEKTITSTYLSKVDKEYAKGLKKLKHIPQLHIKLNQYVKNTNNKLLKQVIEHLN
ncbi:MAG: 2-amino-4-hydroxy-6-hydroxymethyldihydropteridine diphosphokinase [Sphingobacteriaceae bacterium]